MNNKAQAISQPLLEEHGPALMQGGVEEENFVDDLLKKVQQSLQKGIQPNKAKEGEGNGAEEDEEAAKKAKGKAEWSLQKEIEQYKQRTDLKLPHIQVIPGDTIYVWDPSYVVNVTLQYLIYPQDHEVRKLKAIKTIKENKDGTITDSGHQLELDPDTDMPYRFALGTENYNVNIIEEDDEGDYYARDLRTNEQKGACIFNEKVVNFKPCDEDYTENFMTKQWTMDQIEKCAKLDQIQNPQEPKVTEKVKEGWKNEKVKVEAVLSIYFARATNGKPIYSYSEHIDLGKLKYFTTDDQTNRLRVSDDNKILSLCYFRPQDLQNGKVDPDEPVFKIQSWNIEYGEVESIKNREKYGDRLQRVARGKIKCVLCKGKQYMDASDWKAVQIEAEELKLEKKPKKDDSEKQLYKCNKCDEQGMIDCTACDGKKARTIEEWKAKMQNSQNSQNSPPQDSYQSWINNHQLQYERCEQCSGEGIKKDISMTNLNNALNKYYEENHKDFDKLLDINFSSGGGDFVLMKYIQKSKKPEQNLKEKVQEDEENLTAEQKAQKEREKYSRNQIYVLFDALKGKVLMRYGDANTEFKREFECFVQRNDDRQGAVLSMGVKRKKIRSNTYAQDAQKFLDGKVIKECRIQDMLFKQNLDTKTGYMKTSLAVFVSGTFLPLLDLPSSKSYSEEFTIVEIQIRPLHNENNSIEANNQEILNRVKSHIENLNQDSPYLFREQPEYLNLKIDIDPIQFSANADFTSIGLLGNTKSGTKIFTFYHSERQKFIEKQGELQGQNSVSRFHKSFNVQSQQTSGGISFFNRNNGSRKILIAHDVSKDEKNVQILILRPYLEKGQFELKISKTNQVQNIYVHDHINYSNMTFNSTEQLQKREIEFYACQSREEGISFHHNIDQLKSQDDKNTDADQFFSTNQYLQKHAVFPFVAYNLGRKKIAIQSILEKYSQNQKTHILEIEDEFEHFETFIEFKSYDQIGFDYTHINIETATPILFMTSVQKFSQDNFTGKVNVGIQFYLNLVLLDPYYKELQVAQFKSSYGFSNTNYDNFDSYINKAFIQSNVKNVESQSNEGPKFNRVQTIYVIAQQYDKIYRLKLNKDPSANDNEYSSDQKKDFQRFCGLGSDGIQNKVTMRQDPLNQIVYYSASKDGMSYLFMIDPLDPLESNDKICYSIKSKFCHGLGQSDGKIYFMDDNMKIHILEREQLGSRFDKQGERFMSEQEIKTMDFQTALSTDFKSDIIIGSMYILNYHATYYTSTQKAWKDYEQHIQTEHLNFPDQPINLDGQKGDSDKRAAVMIQGSSRYIQTFTYGLHKSYMFIKDAPDAYEHTILLDFTHQAQFSTFLDEGKIMVGLNGRYLIFGNKGQFVDECSFDHLPEKKEKLIMTFEELEKQREEMEKSSTKKRHESSEQATGKDKVLLLLQLNEQRHQTSNSRLVLEKLSNNQEIYLFVDPENKSLIVYELEYKDTHKKEVWVQLKSLLSKSALTQSRYQIYDSDAKSILYQINTEPRFKKKFTINKSNSKIFKKFEELNSKESGVKMSFLTFVKFMMNVEVSDDTHVTFSYCQQKNPNSLQEHVLIVEKYNEKGALLDIKEISQNEFDFNDVDVKKICKELYATRMEQINQQIDKIKLVNAASPESTSCKNQVEAQMYQQEVKRMERKIQLGIVSARQFDEGEILFAWVGNQCKFKVGKGRNGKWKKLEVQLRESSEVMRVIATSNPDHYQIIVQDHVLELIIILTWDVRNDIEVNNKILETNIGQTPAINNSNFVIRGVKQKNNYYMDNGFIVDLESGIPIIQNSSRSQSPDIVNQIMFDSHYQIDQIVEITKQRKLNEDFTQFLGVEQPCKIFYTAHKTCLEEHLKLEKQAIAGNSIANSMKNIFEISDFAVTFNGQSLFHKYALDEAVMQQFSEKYQYSMNNDQLTSNEKRLISMILMKDSDGRTAIELAQQAQKTGSQDIMLKLLSSTSRYNLSRNMLGALPAMIKNATSGALVFFEQACFKTIYLEKPKYLKVAWNRQGEELFTSHTSIIDGEILAKEFCDPSILPDNNPIVPQEDKKVGDEQIIGFKLEEEHDLGAGSTSDNQNLNIEIHDFDWLFENDNAKTLIQMLEEVQNPLVLTSRSISTFIEVVWGEFQLAILYRVVIPTFIYQTFFIYLCCKCLTSYLNESDPSAKDQWQLQVHIVLGVCYLGALGATFYEGRQLVGESFEVYMADVWNKIDIISLIINWVMIILSTICVYYGSWYPSEQIMMIIGSFACFVLWIKLFYWMRLFSFTAYYVKLIIQTIYDCGPFLLMVAIIQAAFGNFYYLFNKDMVGSGTEYISSYTSHEFIDSLLNSYFVSLGKFSYDNYSKEKNEYEKWFIWGIFLMETFIGCVVFMNMLIAIMGNTFVAVQQVSVENGLQEQISLMTDHIWLVDLKKVFKGKKYIVRVSKSSLSPQVNADSLDILKQTKQAILDAQDQVYKYFTSNATMLDFFLKTYNINQNVIDSKMQRVIKSLNEADERAKIEKKEKENKKKLQREKEESKKKKSHQKSKSYYI